MTRHGLNHDSASLCLYPESTEPWLRCVRVFLPPSYILPPRRAENAHLAHPPLPPPAQASGAARGCLVSWIGASESLVDASGTIFSRLQRSLVPMLWFGSQLSGVSGRSRLDFSMFQGSVAWRSHLNKRTSCNLQKPLNWFLAKVTPDFVPLQCGQCYVWYLSAAFAVTG